jgi:hypothetical protein
VHESAPNNPPEAQKRRSTRIVQAVPLTVSGVDALGRPFQERTSTLIINCHGCRYQSKHYVLKNMWVTLEVPHSEPRREPRSMRARVMWIQRPRTVRELFQVGVELEVPGNLWGIAFTPPDWFPFPETPSEQIPVPAEAAAPETEEELWPGESSPEEVEDNVRTMPANGVTESPVAMARHMNRLLNEARQHLQAAVRESAAQAVSAETRPLIHALQAQLQEAAEQSAESAVGAAVEHALHETLSQNERTTEEKLVALRERWGRELGEEIERAGQELATRLQEVAGQRRAAFEQELEAQLEQAVGNLRRVGDDFDAQVAKMQENLDRFRAQAGESSATAVTTIEQQIAAQSEKARAELAELEAAAQQLNERLSAAAAAAQSAWQARLDAGLDDAERRWQERVEGSIENAARQATERLAHDSRAAAERLEGEIGAHLAAMNQTVVEAGSIAETKIDALHASLDSGTRRAHQALSQVQSLAQHVEDQVASLATLTQTAQQELERRASAVVETQSEELARRAEQSVTTWTQRLQPALEAAGQQAVAHLGAEFERHLGSGLERSGVALQRLEEATRSTEEALHRHEESVAKVSDKAIEAALSRVEGALSRLEHDFEESGRVAAAKWLAEMESKATDTTHATFESLFKTADWYEKKVQTQMQTALEKGLEQANHELREKAGEISGLFAAELDHYSRNYVEHTREQFEDASQENREQVSRHSAEMVSNAAASLRQEANSYTEAALGELRAKSGAVLGQVSAQMEARAAQFESQVDADAEKSANEFRSALMQQSQEGLAEARRELASQVDLAKDNLRIEGQTQEQHLRRTMASLAESALTEYKQRLENASNSWLVTTVSRLNQQSEAQIAALEQSAEQRLRETCNQVFAGLGETLRRRMLDVLAPPAEKSDVPGPK